MAHLDVIERRAATAQIMAAIALANGAKDVEMPDPDVMRAHFDEWLVGEPKAIDREKYELMHALGVA